MIFQIYLLQKKEYKYIATPQLIKVPAHSVVEVLVTFDTVKAHGDVKLLAKMAGRDMGHFVYYDVDNRKDKSYKYDLTFHQIVDNTSKSIELENVSANLDGKKMNLIGFGEYEATSGTEFSVTVRPVDKHRNSIKKEM
ncbi:ETX/MTX2 family pore-forming toxin [Bacillus thuringiensis]|uniref:ETX/MTX2 family pore-forming toxin n=1 Tax=Bacillus thuringiensis TaxID=1428 RepID=UPI000B44A01A|nr:ETX/MTX2 family pore-forming toxin [Bacillus thuringiensis]MED3183855.1 ETX/MTX2 family pore-forming toxin [Bacillus thuringiensis]OTY00840.1 hypothetical protein BK734_28610 [Bacillus thuringiensis serovar kim]OUB23008.1 hypothetical protein BK733_00420 [Bacillus thuringiensis serovar xiaguangiensis]